MRDCGEVEWDEEKPSLEFLKTQNNEKKIKITYSQNQKRIIIFDKPIKKLPLEEIEQKLWSETQRAENNVETDERVEERPTWLSRVIFTSKIVVISPFNVFFIVLIITRVNKTVRISKIYFL